MGISSISGVGRAASSTADTPSSAPPTGRPAEASAAAAPKIDEFTQEPVPPRFPWLSRLALQLESAAKQKHAFAPAPLLGDHVDKSA